MYTCLVSYKEGFAWVPFGIDLYDTEQLANIPTMDEFDPLIHDTVLFMDDVWELVDMRDDLDDYDENVRIG